MRRHRDTLASYAFTRLRVPPPQLAPPDAWEKPTRNSDSGYPSIRLSPRTERIVRQDGYRDFADQVSLQPGQKQVVSVTMEKTFTEPLSSVASTVKIAVNPSRAAVFVDGLFVGHVGEFSGLGRAMLVAPGAHRIRIALPGYETFETDINPRPDQKVEIKTDLVKSREPLSDPLLKTGGSNTDSSSSTGGDFGSLSNPAAQK
jgi:PEGA domain